MNKIVEFDSVEKFVAYRKKKACLEVGSGSEGTCYLGKDGLIYKDFTEGFSREWYTPEDIITTDTIESKSFAFPIVIFTVHGEVVGLTTEFITPNLLDFRTMTEETIANTNFDKLIAAYYVIQEDVDILSCKKIKLFDLSSNLMFNGKRLIGVDTCGYTKSTEDVGAFNQECLDAAVKDLFTLFDTTYSKKPIDQKLDTIPYLRGIENRYKDFDRKDKPKQYFKQ